LFLKWKLAEHKLSGLLSERPFGLRIRNRGAGSPLRIPPPITNYIRPCRCNTCKCAATARGLVVALPALVVVPTLMVG
jgi:hypothetical protein